MIIKKIWQGIKDGYEGFINLVILKYRGVRREENVKIHGIIKIYGCKSHRRRQQNHLFPEK